ncbi:MAG: hypothetical protein ACFCU2_09735 [Acidimicrobiia bacterium]
MALVVSVSACSVGQEQLAEDDTSPTFPAELSPSTSGSAQVPTLTDVDIINPTVEFFARGMSGAELANSLEQAVSACMQQRGWTYEPVLQDTSFGEPKTVGELRRFRETYGYGEFAYPQPENGISGVEAADRNAARYSALPPDQQREYLMDLNGGVEEAETSLEDDTPLPGSCLAEARDATAAPLYDEAVMRDMRDMYQAGLESPQMVVAREEWSQCMRDLGYELTQPIDAYDLAVTQGQGLPVEEAVAQETRVASDDFECRLISIIPLEHQIESDIVQTLIERYPEYGDR